MSRSTSWASLAAAGGVGAVAIVAFALGSHVTHAQPSATDPAQQPVSAGARQRSAPASSNHDWSAAPRLAIVATAPGTGHSSLYLLSLPEAATKGASSAKPVLAFQHHGHGNLRAQVVGSTAWVVANTPGRSGRNNSFDGELLRLDPKNGTVKPLCASVAHASRPLVTEDSRVFVSRGTAGPWPKQPERMRTDQLSIDEVDLTNGQLRTVISYHGYLAHLAGAWQDELLIYRVGPHRADVIAVQRDTGAVRTLLATIPPFARDFSVDSSRSALVYRGRDETDRRSWTVELLDLPTGTQHRLFTGASFTLAPAVWPNGDVAYNPQGRGLRLLGRSEPWRSPLGAGVDVLRAVSRDGRFVALLHTVASRLAEAFVLDRDTGAQLRLPGFGRSRIAIAGFYEPTDSVSKPSPNDSEVAP